MVKAVRLAGAAALTALLVSGCGSDGDGDKDPGPGDTPAKGQRSSAPAVDAEPGGDQGDLSGSYVAKAADGPAILTIVGPKATVIAAGHTCSGSLNGTILDLKCADGDTGRTMGLLKRSDAGKKLTVDWEGLSSDDVFIKTPGPDSVPTGLPTDLDLPTGLGLPTGFPTMDLPVRPETGG